MNRNEIYKINDKIFMQYYALPQELFKNPLYKKLSIEAKVLYAFLLDRVTLSQKSNWINPNEEVYLIFTRKEAMNTLNISKPTSIKAFKQLVDVGLIREQKHRANSPKLIYVCKMIPYDEWSY